MSQPEPTIISRAEAKGLGLSRFFTGKPCRRCGRVEERSVSTGKCIHCRREKQRNKFKAKVKAKAAKAKASGLERVIVLCQSCGRIEERALSSPYHCIHRTTITKREWSRNNPDKRAEYSRRTRSKYGSNALDYAHRKECIAIEIEALKILGVTCPLPKDKGRAYQILRKAGLCPSRKEAAERKARQTTT
jgi:hypothetical protein